jgi:hypothetical protein
MELDNETIRDAILELDEEKLKPDNILELIDKCPTKDEIDEILSYNGKFNILIL